MTMCHILPERGGVNKIRVINVKSDTEKQKIERVRFMVRVYVTLLVSGQEMQVDTKKAESQKRD